MSLPEALSTDLDHFEIFFAYSAIGTHPVYGEITPCQRGAALFHATLLDIAQTPAGEILSQCCPTGLPLIPTLLRHLPPCSIGSALRDRLPSA